MRKRLLRRAAGLCIGAKAAGVTARQRAADALAMGMWHLEAAHERVRALHRREPWYAEWWAAIALAGWSLSGLVFPVNMEANPAWGIALRVMDSESWDVVGLVVGLGHLVALYVDWRPFRRAMCLLGSWIFGFLAISLYVSYPGLRSAWFYAIFTGINLYSLVRLRPEGDALEGLGVERN